MASSYSTIGRIELMATSEKNNLWGPIANTGLQLLEDMIAGVTSITSVGGTVTLSANNGATDQSRKGIIVCNAILTSNLVLVIPNVTKTYVIHNRTTGAFSVSIKTSAGNALIIPQGTVVLVSCDAITDVNGKVYFVAPPTMTDSNGYGLQLYRLDSNLAGANATGDQKIFGKGLTVASSTVYMIEMDFTLKKTLGSTTSHALSLNLGGTATVNNFLAKISMNGNAADLVTTFSDEYSYAVRLSEITNMGSNNYTTGSQGATKYSIKGSISINAGGTLNPNYAASVAPGTAYETLAGSTMKIWPIGAAGADVSIGSWA